MTFLRASNITIDSTQLPMVKKYLARRIAGYSDAKKWFDGIMGHHLSAAGPGSADVDFQTTTAVALDVGEQYHKFSSLTATLRGLEGRKPGRVRLSTFYNMSFFTHWRFDEKKERLRWLGALDESDPKAPAVIISNYVMATVNCLDASHLYSICCRNECEDLMSHLEKSLGAASAAPERIEELVAELPSGTVPAPRVLPTALSERLREMAARHGGQVPLHSRLFAQWMHHTYPRECPVPPAPGTTSPQTSEEWMRENGYEDSPASDEEMRQVVASDVCAVDREGKPECGEETDELPWSDEEQLFAVAQPAARSSEGRCLISQVASSCAAFGTLVMALLILIGIVRVSILPKRLKNMLPNLEKNVAAVVCLLCAYALDVISLPAVLFAGFIGVIVRAIDTMLCGAGAPSQGDIAKKSKNILPV